MEVKISSDQKRLFFAISLYPHKPISKQNPQLGFETSFLSFVAYLFNLNQFKTKWIPLVVSVKIENSELPTIVKLFYEKVFKK